MLVTAAGYVTNHVSRTGDHDAVLAFWVLLISLLAYRLGKEEQPDKRIIYSIGFILSAAVLTKGVAAFFPLPFIFLWLAYKRKVLPILQNKHTWIAAFLCLTLASSYYVYSEISSPGFLNTLWFQEIGGRYTGENHGHNHSWYFYFIQLLSNDFTPWIYVLPLLAIKKIRIQINKYDDLVYYLLFAGFSILIILSVSSTKCEWYSAPVFPLFALACGIILTATANIIAHLFRTQTPFRLFAIKWILVAIVFCIPYKNTIKRISFPQKEWVENQYGEWLRKLAPGQTISILTDRQPNYCVMYYVAALNAKNKSEFSIKNPAYKIKLNELIICSDASEKFSKHFHYKEVDRYKQLELIRIESRIQH
ncbi:MAG: hypothetical protein R2850_00510 [Bacteroidia bacterium]